MDGKLHYHVCTVSPRINVPSLIFDEKELAQRNYLSIINLVSDMTGLEVAESTDNATNFNDGLTRVRIVECNCEFCLS